MAFLAIRFSRVNLNKTGLQPVSRPVEQVHYLRGWRVGGILWYIDLGNCKFSYK